MARTMAQMAFHNSYSHDKQYPQAPGEQCMQKEEEPSWQILLEVSRSAPRNKPAAVDPEISDVDVTTEAQNCINFIKM